MNHACYRTNLARLEAAARGLRHQRAGDAGDDGLDAGGRPPPRVEGLRAQVPRHRNLDRRGPASASRRPSSTTTTVKEATRGAGSQRGAKCPTATCSTSSRTPFASRRPKRARSRSRISTRVDAAYEALDKSADDDVRPATARAASPGDLDSLRQASPLPRREPGLGKEIPSRPTWTSPAASTSWASATSCPRASSTTLQDQGQRVRSTQVDKATVAVQNAKTHRLKLGIARGRDDGRRDRRQEETRRPGRASGTQLEKAALRARRTSS